MRIRVNRIRREREKGASRSPAGYDGHFHVDCSLEANFASSRAGKSPSNSPKEVHEWLEMFAAERSGQVCADGQFLIARKELPKRGVVDALLEVSANVEDAAMAITGVTFEIQNHPPYQRLRWKLTPETKSATELRVWIATADDLDKTGGSLESISQVLWRGVEELVFEVVSKRGA